jgi:hypothetical protein
MTSRPKATIMADNTTIAAATREKDINRFMVYTVSADFDPAAGR